MSAALRAFGERAGRRFSARPAGSVRGLPTHGSTRAAELIRQALLAIRTELLKKDGREAVIGLAPYLFYGTGIPACVLVLRPPDRKDSAREGNVLFINADREFHAEPAQNVLLPEHAEKIVSTFHAYAEVPGLSRIVTREELAANDDNLNIRRYVDNMPPPEPQDVRAHLVGRRGLATRRDSGQVPPGPGTPRPALVRGG
ncbi:N-6 DNA methylase [Streptomyces sp. NPDC050997]|uniref:N-6 DNA methylase n=1 Tax=Streptomyces sp. NPDC050997 TaxID=3155519 RepID=UPI003425B591